MAVFNKFNIWVQNAGDGIYDLNADSIYLMLTDTVPNVGDTVYNHTAAQVQSVSNAAEIAGGNGYTQGGAIISSTAYSQSSGLATLTGTGPTWTASGGSIATFRYFVAYDLTAGTVTTRPLLGWWDYGSALTITSGNTITATFSSGILTLQ
jgi:hypothetical protein